MVTNRIHIALIMTLFCGPVFSQTGKDGVPVGWGLSSVQANVTDWELLPAMDIPALLSEDEQWAGLKSVPSRFALAYPVNFTTAQNGQWKNLSNGDRMWVLGIQCENALAYSIEFSQLLIPDGATLYIYSQDRSDFAGPVTSSQNRGGGIFGTAPVAGNRVVLEYYEPFHHRGEGKIAVSSVACSYRNVEQLLSEEVSQCLAFRQDVPFGESSWNMLRSSVLLMMVDHGQRAITGTMINNGRHDGVPYVVTALQGLVGDPSSWVFVQGFDGSCSAGQACWDRFLSGAELLDSDPGSGIALLRLREYPRKTWRQFLSGWRVGSNGSDEYLCLQHAFASSLSASVFKGAPGKGNWGPFETMMINEWEIGGTFSGSLGSPLFNSSGELIGVFVGGENRCSDNGADHFSPLLAAWDGFKNFLDPFSNNQPSIPGLLSRFEHNPEGQSEPELVIFPNPAAGLFSIQNNSDEPITSVELIDAMGKICKEWDGAYPDLNIGDQPDGAYILRIRQNSRVVLRRLIIQQ